jgi:hypothetical protein
LTKPDFVTLAGDLFGAAELVEAYFEDKGYKVVREPEVLAYPYTPTLRCKRDRTTIVVEFDEVIRSERARDWVRYGCSLNTDFRVGVAFPASAPRDLEVEESLRSEKVGLYVAGEPVTEVAMPHDLSLNMSLPELARLPPKIRKVLGPMYEQYEHSHWREAFESGCQAFETECRKYLKAAIASGRIKVLGDNGRPRKLSSATIDKMSLGTLAVAFSGIDAPNHADTALASILSEINPNRILVAHHKTKASSEARLRKYVGNDVWLFVAGLRKIYG